MLDLLLNLPSNQLEMICAVMLFILFLVCGWISHEIVK